MTNINIHPAQCPPVYILVPYTFIKLDKHAGEEQVEGETDSKCISIRPIFVKTFNDIKLEVKKALNLPYSVKVILEPIGEEDFEEGLCFGSSIHVEVQTQDYYFSIDFDCFQSINAYAWGKNCSVWD